MIIYAVSSGNGGHFVSSTTTHTMATHSVFGMIIISLIVVQMGLGLWSDIWWRLRFWKTGAIPLPAPFPEKTHWWLGRFLVVASIVQIFLGLVEGQTALRYGAWV